MTKGTNHLSLKMKLLKRIVNIWKMGEYRIVEYPSQQKTEIVKDFAKRVKKLAVITESEDQKVDANEFTWE